MSTEIKQLSKLLNLTITKQEIKRLTSPGENYGSLMLSMDVTTDDGELHFVAKLVPPNAFLQDLFNSFVTFRNEIALYKHVFPLLQSFQRENSMKSTIDFFPEYHASRLNLTGGNDVDNDAALVLKNLRFDGFVSLNPTLGFDYNQTKLVLNDLAELHAVSLCFKLRKPEQFREKIVPYLERWVSKEQNYNKFKEALILVINEVAELQPLKDRILKAYAKQLAPYEPREPFATLTHNDCWISNIMVKFDGSKTAKTKILDFQVCSYGSPARDLVFFLFSSVENEIIEQQFDDLLRLYHERFVSILKELHCDTTPFSFEDLENEMREEAGNSEFGHTCFMLFVIFAVKNKVVDITQLTRENLVQTEFTPALKNKVAFLVKEFAKRNWI